MANARADSRVSAPDHELRTRYDADSGPPLSDGPPSVGSGRGLNDFNHASVTNLGGLRLGFWGSMAQKARSLMEDDSSRMKPANPKSSSSILWEMSSQKKEGLSIAENKGEAIIKETHKLNARRKQSGSHLQSQTPDTYISQRAYSQIPLDQEIQLKAARDVRLQAQWLPRQNCLGGEVKTAKMDLAFAKERCAQLQGENKALRESHERGKSNMCSQTCAVK